MARPDDSNDPSLGSDRTLAATPTSDPGATPTSSPSPPSTLTGPTGSLAFATRIAGRYEILGLLGTGGMGAVYRVRDTELDEVVALKMLHRELAVDAQLLARFRQEAKLARRVTHRNVARTYDIGEVAPGGEKFLTMELVEGESLAAQIDRDGRLPLARVVAIGLELCGALAAAHAAGVVHRDLKPENVLIGRDGRVVVTDFGISTLVVAADRTQLPTALEGGASGGGTPAYMAPEQVEGFVDVDARADLYALGEILYEALTGERAWPGEQPFAVAVARLSAPAPDVRARRPEVPASLGAVLQRSMARRREDRPGSAEELAGALRTVAAELESQTRPPAAALQQAVAAPLVPTGAAVRTVAVLPFKNSGPPEDAYIADGLTDDLIDTLAMTAGLRVRPRSLLARLGEVPPPLDEIGRRLDVAVVVEGSVRRTPSGFRVAARVLSVADSFQLWSQRFDRPATDLLALNDELAHAVAAALTVEKRDAPLRGTVDARAVELYLRARIELRSAWFHPVAMQRAVVLLDEAVALSPEDPSMLAALAHARARLAVWIAPVPGQGSTLADALAAADRAIAVSPSHSEPWLALALVRLHEPDYAATMRALRRAISLPPPSAIALSTCGTLLAEADRLDEARRLNEAALAIDPSAIMPRWDLARLAAFDGDWAKADFYGTLPVERMAERALREGLRVRLALWRHGARPEGIPPVDEVLEADEETRSTPPRLVGRFFRAVMQHGRVDAHALTQVVASARRSSGRTRGFLLQLVTEIHAAVGDLESARRTIAEAATTGLFDLAWFDRCPLLAPLRGGADFREARALVAARAAEVTRVYDAG